jgi:hypothetical protein
VYPFVSNDMIREIEMIAWFLSFFSITQYV